jgi:hypothetical protein
VGGEGRQEPLPPRVSQETAKRQKLDRLVDADEGLKRVVDRLDLEFID